MDRFTDRNFNFTADFVARHLDSFPIAQCLSKFQEYENAVEDGLLVRLPCKAEDEETKLNQKMSKTKQEQVTAAVGSLQPRTVFSYGGVNWVVLGYKDTSVLCLAEKVLFNKAFDNGNCNNWAKSSLRKYLNDEFLKWLIKGGAEKSDFVPMVTDLTADDGLKDYGSCEDIISLISCYQYRQYSGIIPKIDDFWWTCTAYSTKANGYSCFARFVYSDGTLYGYNACNGSNGVRPLCTLKSSALVSIIDIAEGEELESSSEDSEAATQSDDEQETPPECYTDDIRTQKIIDDFYDCVEKAQQHYMKTGDGFSEIVKAMETIKFLKSGFPF